jgi:hypothetical protein
LRICCSNQTHDCEKVELRLVANQIFDAVTIVTNSTIRQCVV